MHIFGITTFVKVVHEPLQTPCRVRKIVFSRSRDDEQLPGQRHPYALRDLQCPHSCVCVLESVGDETVELELVVAFHALIVPSAASCRFTGPQHWP
ncbi:hypothetical protein SAZ_30075 [Streptomyces noursei ZPM]|nr:hypothetical protein SAZ_30075 [Streptomyces noursei ZPM]EXU91796.1 hypothetical protein P354_38735 [Streptomyces noursei PD-1]